MTETKPAYHTNGHSNGNGSAGSPQGAIDASELVPSAWLRFLYRMAGLERGRIYTITLVVPEKASSEPQWAIQAAGVIENGKRL